MAFPHCPLHLDWYGQGFTRRTKALGLGMNHSWRAHWVWKGAKSKCVETVHLVFRVNVTLHAAGEWSHQDACSGVQLHTGWLWSWVYSSSWLLYLMNLLWKVQIPFWFFFSFCLSLVFVSHAEKNDQAHSFCIIGFLRFTPLLCLLCCWICPESHYISSMLQSLPALLPSVCTLCWLQVKSFPCVNFTVLVLTR